MNDVVKHIIAIGAYPGLLTMLVLTTLVSLITHMHAPGGGLSRGILATVRGSSSALILGAALIPLGLAAALPWPGSLIPWQPANIWLIWAGLEASCLLALLPGLYHSTPTGVRAAMREAQMGALGRMLLWAAIGTSRWIGSWDVMYLPIQGLALLAALFALPVALGWGTFAPVNDITPGGAEAGMSRADYEMAIWGRAIRSTVLLSLIPLLMFTEMTALPMALNIGLVIVAILGFAGLGRAINGHIVRRPLLDSLRLSMVRIVPLLVVAAVAKVIIERL